MNNSSDRTSTFWDDQKGGDNSLLEYVQSMTPETVAQLSRPVSQDVMQVMEHNIIGLLGGLPSQHFDISVTTSREQLGRLLASAMMSGYFLKGAEQRLAFEESVVAAGPGQDLE
ncbi:MAG: DUF760 domain-containing protein [Cyanobacteria bacterium P01_C01_bin.120]